MRGKRENESSELEVIGFRRLTSCKLPVFRSNVKLQVAGFGQTITWNAPVSAGVENCAAPEIGDSTANTSVVNGEKNGRKGEFRNSGRFFREFSHCVGWTFAGQQVSEVAEPGSTGKADGWGWRAAV